MQEQLAKIARESQEQEERERKQTQRKKEEIKRQEEEARNRREHTVEDSKIVDGLFGFLGLYVGNMSIRNCQLRICGNYNINATKIAFPPILERITVLPASDK